MRGCLPRRAETEETQQRSDGEDEEVPSLGDVPNKNSALLGLDTNFSVDTGADDNDVEHEQILMQAQPCIINTENFALNDLVKYMHPYCLPAITMCLESEEDESLMSDEVFLEIVSEQGECIKVPVVVEPPADMLCSDSSDDMEEMDVQMENVPNNLSPREQGVPELEMNRVNQIDCKSDEVPEPMENYTDVPKLPDLSPQPPAAGAMVEKTLDDDICNSEVISDCKKTSEPNITVSVAKEKVPLKGKRSSKDKQPSKSKLKSKMKSATGDKSLDAPEPVTVQSIAQPPASRPSNPSLQESDFLTKTLDQVKKESQMELRSSKIGRTKTRTRASLDISKPEKKITDWKAKPVSKESEQAKSSIEKDLEQNPKLENPKSEETRDSAVTVEGLQSNKEDVKDMLVSPPIGEEVSCSNEESGALRVEDVQDGDFSQPMKEAKPKSLSLSEYRKRLKHRKPDPERDNENLSCSKWPTVPEPPKELAELPCLVVPAQSNKPSIGGKACPANQAGNIPVISASVPNTVIPTPVSNQDIQQFNGKPPILTPQPNMPPPFYPPAWPTVPPHPFYPGMPSIPHYPNGMPVQPPPVMNWPPYPPPPIAVPPVHPMGWVSGPPAPFWPNAQMAHRMIVNQSFHNSPEKSVPFSATNLHALPDQKMLQETVVPPKECRPQTAVVQSIRAPVLKPENSVGLKEPKTSAKPESVKHDKSPTRDGPQVRPALKSDTSSLAMEAAKKSQNAPSLDPKKANVPVSDLKSANQVVFKIMEILKKAQKLGFQIKPSSDAIANTQLGIQVSPSVSALEPAQPKQIVLAGVKAQVVPPPIVEESSIQETSPQLLKNHLLQVRSEDEKIPATGSVIAREVAEDKLASAGKVSKEAAKEPVHLPCAETLCASEGSFQTTAEPNLKEPEKSFTCESGKKIKLHPLLALQFGQ